MLYAIMATDVADSIELRKKTRPRHIEYLQTLIAEGRVVLAGPHPATDGANAGTAGFTGSLIVAEFDSLEDALDWAAGDPYAQDEIFEEVRVKPFLKVAP